MFLDGQVRAHSVVTCVAVVVDATERQRDVARAVDVVTHGKPAVARGADAAISVGGEAHKIKAGNRVDREWLRGRGVLGIEEDGAGRGNVEEGLKGAAAELTTGDAVAGIGCGGQGGDVVGQTGAGAGACEEDFRVVGGSCH
nr:hypothetical protein CFP56_54888 [Quercus suber]